MNMNKNMNCIDADYNLTPYIPYPYDPYHGWVGPLRPLRPIIYD